MKPLLDLFSFLPEHKLQGSTGETVSFPNLIFQIPGIGKVHQLPVIDLEAEQRRFYANLCHIVYFQPSALV